jgi:MinD-like ATPase involved in chromosome partitioning or flagellar assembly
MPDTRFIAFYSYKGGVGRSLTLANLAFLLWKQGKKVCILDFDLEAPGQHATDLFKLDDPGPGLVDLLLAFLDSQDDDTRPFSVGDQLDQHLRPSTPLRNFAAQLEARKEDRPATKNSVPTPGTLHLMPAGRVGTPEYTAKLDRLNWDEFYRKGGRAFFRVLRQRLQDHGFDDVLIDSRTGLSDIFFITTLNMADTVVCVSGFNRQNIEGTRQAVELLTDPETESEYGQKRIILVGSPEPIVTPDALVKRLNEIREREWPDFRDFHETVGYVPGLALEERIYCLDMARADRSVGYTETMDRILTVLDSDASLESAVRMVETTPSNPFNLIRKDYLTTRDVVRYYVDPGNVVAKGMDEFMPLVITGARGSGKTMLAHRYSLDAWHESRSEAGLPPDPSQLVQIGLYFCIHPDFLSSFASTDPDVSPYIDQLFSLYFDLEVISKMLAALESLGGIDAWCDSSRFFADLLAEMGEDNPSRSTYERFQSKSDEANRSIRAFLNNPGSSPRPYFVQPNALVALLVRYLARDNRFSKRYFALMVDEYENFSDRQQRIVNSRLKQSRRDELVTYRLFMRSSDLLTRETLVRGQTIQETHDYRAYSLDGDKGFEAHAIAVANRHLELNPYFFRIGQTSIAGLFEELSAEDEARNLTSGNRGDQLRKWVGKHFPQDETLILAWFNEEPSPLRRATAVVIMNQGGRHKSPQQVVAEFRADQEKARVWYHNYHRGALHWLCRLYSTEKRYAGLKALLGLSGQNIRVFLDFCHAIIDLWQTKDMPPLPVPWQIQDEAVKDQAKVYQDNLRSSDRSAREINNLLDRLGSLFEVIHKSPKQSEPEINHFSIRGQLDDPEEVRQLETWLKDALNEGLLRRLKANKRKDLKELRQDDWQLAPWFAPLFGISTRRKKKMPLEVEDLRIMFTGRQSEWAQVFDTYRSRYEAGDEARTVQQWRLDLDG